MWSVTTDEVCSIAVVIWNNGLPWYTIIFHWEFFLYSGAHRNGIALYRTIKVLLNWNEFGCTQACYHLCAHDCHYLCMLDCYHLFRHDFMGGVGKARPWCVCDQCVTEERRYGRSVTGFWAIMGCERPVTAWPIRGCANHCITKEGMWETGYAWLKRVYRDQTGCCVTEETRTWETSDCMINKRSWETDHWVTDWTM